MSFGYGNVEHDQRAIEGVSAFVLLLANELGILLDGATGGFAVWSSWIVRFGVSVSLYQIGDISLLVFDGEKAVGDQVIFMAFSSPGKGNLGGEVGGDGVAGDIGQA